MIYGSVCSGIEAATCAWHTLGWKPAWFSEIEPFASAILNHHFPEVTNRGDFTSINDAPGSIDLLVGGTPCQSFSVAGRRAGLDDARGNLTMEFVRLAARTKPRWVLWENVPGVLSIDGGRTFGTFLGALGQCGYGTAYRILDAQHFGVPQRRRRVFVVGYLGDWRCAAAVLFERASLRRDIKAGGKARQTIAGTLKACAGKSGAPTRDSVTHPLRGEAHDGSEDGTGRGIPFIAFDTTQITSKANRSNPKPGDPSHPLTSMGHAPTIAFLTNLSGTQCARSEDLAPSIGSANPMAAAQVQWASGGGETENPTAQALRSGAETNYQFLRVQSSVRRLTPRECERLQGFPDDWTLIPWRGKKRELCPDSPRYRAIGNSMAVPVMRWIGERIQAVEYICESER